MSTSNSRGVTRAEGGAVLWTAVLAAALAGGTGSQAQSPPAPAGQPPAPERSAGAARPPAPPPYRKADPFLLARPRAAGQPLRAGRNAALVRRLQQPGGKEVKLPGSPADWELILSGPERERVYRYWERPGVLAELALGKHLPARGRRVAGLGEALAGLPAQPRAAALLAGAVDPPLATLAKIEGAGPNTIGGIFGHATHVFLGRVLGVAELGRDEHIDRIRVPVYLLEVLRDYRQDRPQPQRYVRLRWQPLRRDGCKVALDQPVLREGEVFVFFASPTVRRFSDEWGNEWYEDHGEEVIKSRAWGPVGLGIVRVRDGVMVPPFPWVEEWLAQEIASGRGMPTFGGFGFRGAPRPPVMPVWGLSFAAYDAHLRELGAQHREYISKHREQP